MQYLKIIAVALIAILIVNMILYAINRVSLIQFWATIIIIAIVAYIIIPKIRMQ